MHKLKPFEPFQTYVSTRWHFSTKSLINDWSDIISSQHTADITSINSAFLPRLKESTTEQTSYKTSLLVSLSNCLFWHKHFSTSWVTFNIPESDGVYSAQNMLSIFLLLECLCSRRGSCLTVTRRSALDLWLTEAVFTWKPALIQQQLTTTQHKHLLGYRPSRRSCFVRTQICSGLKIGLII